LFTSVGLGIAYKSFMKKQKHNVLLYDEPSLPNIDFPAAGLAARTGAAPAPAEEKANQNTLHSLLAGYEQ
jgi:hypothetical protein